MINPTPVPPRQTPYRSTDSVTRPLPASSLSANNPKQSHSKRRIVTLLAIMVLGTVGYAFARYRNLTNSVLVNHEGASSQILTLGSNIDVSKLDSSQFTQTGDGLFNLLILGVGGQGHDGAYLTDAMKVASFDTIHKTVTIISIPRDFGVMIPNYGLAKINSSYELGEQNHAGGGFTLAKQMAERVLGIRIQNAVMVDFSGAKQLVDIVGGVDITSTLPISDPTYPAADDVHYDPFYLSPGLHHMDGALALKYMRERHSGSDFTRAANQNQVLNAAKQKALSLGTLANPVKVSQIITTLADHIRTDLTQDQIKTLISLYSASSPSKTYVLDTSESLGLLSSKVDPTAGYIEYPALGLNTFTDIHRWVQKVDQDPLLASEKATITVANSGKATTKQMQDLVATLNDYGYTATLAPSNVSVPHTTTTTLYATNKNKPISLNYLNYTFSVSAKNGSPLSLPSNTDFQLIYVPGTPLK